MAGVNSVTRRKKAGRKNGASAPSRKRRKLSEEDRKLLTEFLEKSLEQLRSGHISIKAADLLRALAMKSEAAANGDEKQLFQMIDEFKKETGEEPARPETGTDAESAK